MTAAHQLDILRNATANCAGVVVLSGAPLSLSDASGDPALAGWASWAEAVDAATSLLLEAPVPCTEALVRLPGAIVLLESRPTGAVVVVMELARGGAAVAGMVLMQARVVASQLQVPEPRLPDPLAPRLPDPEAS